MHKWLKTKRRVCGLLGALPVGDSRRICGCARHLRTRHGTRALRVPAAAERTERGSGEMRPCGAENLICSLKVEFPLLYCAFNRT
jgi:hypothetical protein